MNARRALLPVCVIGALLTGGCGSTPLSLKDLRQDATAICQTAVRRTAQIAAPAAPDGTSAFLAAGIAALAPELHDLRGLNPPSAQQASFRTATGAAARSLALLRETRTAIAHGTDAAAAVRGLQSSLAPVQARGNSVWQQLGIPACVSR
ncbi:MAG TPA: hypothetical protein VLP43_10045 [Solirubrobacteraceae bacterium]|nr:hypothetical protein [Solirubrobacteraceae bacterium]